MNEKPYILYTAVHGAHNSYYILDGNNDLLYKQAEGHPWEKQLTHKESGRYVKIYYQFVRYMSEEELFLELL